MGVTPETVSVEISSPLNVSRAVDDVTNVDEPLSGTAITAEFACSVRGPAKFKVDTFD